MPTATNGVDYVSAPKDYAELHRIYYKYVVNLVFKHGIKQDSKEDVASEILAKFLERGFLEKFDPNLTFEYKGTMRPARFQSFLSNFVLLYVRGHQERQFRTSKRELLICDLLVGDNRHSQAETWVARYGEPIDGPEDDVLDDVMENDLVIGLRSYLADVPRRSHADRCDLVALFDAVVEQVRDRGECNLYQLSNKFNVSYTAMHTWMWWLKANLAHALGRPIPKKRPHRTKS